MARYLCLSATMLTAKYHPEDWPPAPARAFQALLAGVMTGGYRQFRPACEAALQWLEQQPPPEIYARKAHRGVPYRLAVPNNDFDAVARKWREGVWSDPARIRTLKDVRPNFLPDDGPHVHYVWNVESQPAAVLETQVAALNMVARCLHTLGWGVDMAFAEAALLDEACFPGFEHWEVAAFGRAMDVPVPGFLADLRHAYDRFLARTMGEGVDPDTRPTMVGLQHYRRKGELRRPFAAFRLVRPDKTTGADRPYSRAPHESMRVAAWLRHATGEALKGWRDEKFRMEYVFGHIESGDRSDRLSYVPLPSAFGHRHVDGWIRRVAVVEPFKKSGEVTQQIRQLLAGTCLQEDGKVEPVCSLSPIEPSEIPGYVRSFSAWRSVTPVILHGFNMQGRRVSLVKTEKLLLEAFSESGYPRSSIRRLDIQPAPFVPGAIGARDVLVPAHLSKWPRYHVRVEFHSEIPGPVLVGIGRHYGIGLFVGEF